MSRSLRYIWTQSIRTPIVTYMANIKPPAKAWPFIKAMVGIEYVRRRLNRANKLSGKKPGVEVACSRSKPLLKNFWTPDVVITTPGG